MLPQEVMAYSHGYKCNAFHFLSWHCTPEPSKQPIYLSPGHFIKWVSCLGRKYADRQAELSGPPEEEVCWREVSSKAWRAHYENYPKLLPEIGTSPSRQGGVREAGTDHSSKEEQDEGGYK